MPKQFAFDADAREKLRRGFDQLADTVRVTLGPRGRNVILDKTGSTPAITNDGVTIAKEITLADPFENIGAELAKEVSVKTQETAGDGTTTAVVLAQALVQEGLRVVAAGVNPMGVKRGMDKAAVAVLEDVARRARRVRGQADVEAVAVLAANHDEVLGRLIAQALERVGPNGVVTVEEGKGLLTTLEVVEGMQFDQGYLSPYFVTDPERMVAEMESPYLLLHDQKITQLNELEPLLQRVVGRGRPLLIVAEDIEGEALATLVVNRLRGTLLAVGVKAVGFGDRRRAFLEDLAVLTGARVLSEETGSTVADASLADLGQAERVSVGKSETTVVGGRGKKTVIAARVAQLKRQITEAESEYDREKLEERLAKLAGGVGVVRVGAATAVEMHETKARAEDALAATRAAVAEGIVIGGGSVLLRACAVVDALELTGPEEIGARVLQRALAAPLRQIAENAGVSGAMMAERVKEVAGATVGFNAQSGRVEDLASEGVWDPAKVVRCALQNAVSIAGLVLTTETLVVEVPDTDEDPQP